MMIDTIILTIPREQITFLKTPYSTNWTLHSKFGIFSKHIKQCSSQQKKDGVYRPRLSMITRGKKIFIRIEFSIPKLLYGNNVDEVSESDFPIIVTTLKKRLEDFGVVISKVAIKSASVSSFHPSKNILLVDGYTASGVIKELNKINLTTRMDLTKDTFRNEGQSLQFYTNSHSLVIYDKVADIKKPKSRAIDKDKTQKQQSLFEPLNKKGNIEIVRLEIRLSKKVKMNSVLKKNGFNDNPTFEEIFKNGICQKIVENYWKTFVIDKHLFLFSLSNSPQDTLEKLIIKYPTIKPKELLYLIGLQQLSTDTFGIRNLRKILTQNAHDRTWYRISNDLIKLNDLHNITECHTWVSQISKQINDFAPLKISDLLCKEK